MMNKSSMLRVLSSSSSLLLETIVLSGIITIITDKYNVALSFLIIVMAIKSSDHNLFKQC